MRDKLEIRVGFFICAAIGVFLYMGFKIGTFQFDRSNYHLYTLYFKDVSGLSRKAEVKIAGVKIGWVERVELDRDAQDEKVRVSIMILKSYALYSNAYGVVRQDGLLGAKFIEIIPGDPLLCRLDGGTVLAPPLKSLHSIEELLTQLGAVGHHIEHVAVDICDTVIPQIGKTLSSVEESIQEASQHACDNMRTIAAITQKIDNGTGLVGKLINEDDIYCDIRSSVKSIRAYLAKLSRIHITFDFHLEAFARSAEGYCFGDSKGYCNLWIQPSQDYFYMLQIVSSERGFRWRKEVHPTYADECGRCVDTNLLELSDHDKLRFIFTRKEEIVKRNQLLFGIQVGKIFGDVTVRIGLFENSAGVGIDVRMPFEKIRWISTLEAFDFNGWNRHNDRRPHLKWLNQISFLRGTYLVLGVDDFVSRHNKSFFAGIGLRFGDDDVKYLLSGVSGGAGALM